MQERVQERVWAFLLKTVALCSLESSWFLVLMVETLQAAPSGHPAGELEQWPQTQKTLPSAVKSWRKR